MNDVKWIKIVVDIFDDEKIKLIESLPSSDTIIVIWFKILCLAGQQNNNGILMMNNRIPYTEEMLSAIFRRKTSDVQMALKVFEEYGMIEIIDNVYVIPNWDKHQSLDSFEKKKERDREYQRKRREKQKMLIDNSEDVSEKKSSDNRLTVGRFCSYSFSNNSNIKNLNYLIDNSIYKYSWYLIDNPILLSNIKDWMENKDNLKPKSANHYTEQGMKSLLTEIIGYHKDYGDEAVRDVINHTIAGQWKGIVWDWMEKKYQKIKHPIELTIINPDRPQRFRLCPDSTWEKLKPFVSSDGSFNWSDFDQSVLTDADREWMRKNDM